MQGKAVPCSYLMTDEDGRAEGYLSSGEYSIEIKALDFITAKKKIKIKDNSVSIGVRLNPVFENDIEPPINNPEDGDNVFSGKNVRMHVLGGNHSGAITEDGSLYMWGNNYYGQLGDGTIVDRQIPVKILDHVVSFSLGWDHSGAITEDGCLYMWGNNKNGKLGDGTTIDRSKPVKVLEHVVSISLGGTHSGAITEDGDLYMWGCNSSGRLGNGTTKDNYVPIKIMENVISVSLGYYHSGAVTENGELYMWGNNETGQLGDGTTIDTNVPVNVLENIISVSLGGNHSGAIGKNGHLYMWGCNVVGQLGDKTTEDKNLPLDIVKKEKNSISKKAVKIDRGLFRLNKIGDISPSWTFKEDKNKIDLFSELVPNTYYNYYVLKDKKADNLLKAENIVYMTGNMAGDDGSLRFMYHATEDIGHVDTFLVSLQRIDITNAIVNISDLEYNQKQLYVHLVVIYQGEILEEWEDYELLGDYSATEVGNYTVTIHGIGDYKGSVDASYKITEVKSRKVERISLSVADASLNTGNTLQLMAEVFPENAENRTLKWASSDEKVAVVDDNGLVTAIGAGEATITVESQDGSGVSASCVITVTKLADTPSGVSSTGGSSGGTTGGSSSGGSSGGYPSGGSSGEIPSSNPSGGSPGNDPGSIPSENDPNNGNNGELQVRLLYYIVNFNANGGNNLSRKTMTLLMDDTLGILPKIQRKQYDFKGWYTQKSGGEKVTQATVLNVSTTLYAQWAKTAKSAKPAKLSLTAKKGRQMKVSYKKVSGASGYQIAYSTNKKFASSATKKVTTSSTSKTLKNLKKGKTYYVRVRAYQTDSVGNKVYGTYSGKKSIKIKA